MNAFAPALQCLFVKSEYILPSLKVEIKSERICPSNLDLKSFDLAFLPDLQPTSTLAPQIPYAKIGINITIAPSHDLAPLTISDHDVEEEVTANAESHLQKSERRKIMPRATYEETTREVLIHGDTFIGDINA